nr:helix-turn-helix domain-containing protein [Angustibacter aerolatus]
MIDGVSLLPSGEPRPRYDLERLLAVAVQVFIERGYDATSMHDVSAASGLSKSSLYHHVTSKEQVAAAGARARPRAAARQHRGTRGAARPGDRPPAAPGAARRAGAGRAGALRHPAAARARQHRDRALGPRPAPPLRPHRRRPGAAGRRRGRRAPRRRRPHHRAPRLRRRQLARRVVPPGQRPNPRPGSPTRSSRLVLRGITA